MSGPVTSLSLRARPVTTPATTRLGADAVVVLVVVLLGLGFLLQSASWLPARFGESHDGRNAAVWAAGSRAMREDGLIDSRLGGMSRPGGYANHPPGILVTTYLAESIGGERRIVSRAPAWMASLAVLALLALLLRRAGSSPLAVVVALVVVTSSSMFLVYGSMLDTPVTSLPVSVGVLIAALAVVQGRRPPTPVLVGLAVLAALTGWQAVAFTVAAGVWIGVTWAARRWRPATDRPPVRILPAVLLALGTSVGLALTLAWVRWVYGGFAPLSGNARYRADAGWAEFARDQLEYLRDLVPIAGVVGGLGLVLAVRDRSLRGLALTSVGAVAGYALAFRGGATIHDYWNFAVIVPLAVGAAALADGAMTALARAERVRPERLVVGAGLLVALSSLAMPSLARSTLEASLGTPDLVDEAAAHAPADGPVTAYVSGGGATSPWVPYETRRSALVLHDQDELEALARTDPEFPVLVAIVGPGREELRRAAWAIDGPWAVAPAAAVAAALA